MVILNLLIGGMTGILVPLIAILVAKRMRKAMAVKTEAEAEKTDADKDKTIGETWQIINGNITDRLEKAEKKYDDLVIKYDELRDHQREHDDEMHAVQQDNERLRRENAELKREIGEIRTMINQGKMKEEAP